MLCWKLDIVMIKKTSLKSAFHDMNMNKMYMNNEYE